jgi:hypothetical protein
MKLLYILLVAFVLGFLSGMAQAEVVLPDLGEPANSSRASHWKELAPAYTTAMVFHAVDWKQTRWIATGTDPDIEEKNIFLGPKPGAAAVNLWFIGTAVAMTIAADQLPTKYANLLVKSWAVVEVVVVANNARLGVKLEW